MSVVVYDMVVKGPSNGLVYVFDQGDPYVVAPLYFFEQLSVVSV